LIPKQFQVTTVRHDVIHYGGQSGDGLLRTRYTAGGLLQEKFTLFTPLPVIVKVAIVIRFLRLFPHRPLVPLTSSADTQHTAARYAAW
jgi:hypothetical protein